jgi:hypothetical protein
MQVDTFGGGDDLELRHSSIVGFARASGLGLRRPGHLEVQERRVIGAGGSVGPVTNGWIVARGP